jgi:chemotaxis protein methyltransferase CheR
MRLSGFDRSVFRTGAPDGYRIDAGLRNSIKFTRANLIDVKNMAHYRDFDIVFCRNVLTYFDDSSRRIAAENLYDCLRPGGYICLGHSETMSRISPLFQVCRFSDAIVYQRPEADHGQPEQTLYSQRPRRILIVDDSSRVRLITARRSRRRASQRTRPSTA